MITNKKPAKPKTKTGSGYFLKGSMIKKITIEFKNKTINIEHDGLDVVEVLGLLDLAKIHFNNLQIEKMMAKTTEFFIQGLAQEFNKKMENVTSFGDLKEAIEKEVQNNKQKRR